MRKPFNFFDKLCNLINSEYSKRKQILRFLWLVSKWHQMRNSSSFRAIKMITFILISTLLSVVIAQQSSLSCNYALYAGIYSCDLTINNPNGLNNFTEIGGIHLEGHTDDDVTTVYRVSGVSTNVPSIICEQFTNLDSIELYFTGLIAIGDSDFAGCPRVTGLGLSANLISEISTNAFATLTELVYINLDTNSLTTLPENVFSNQRNLRNLDLSSNPFQDIPTGLFRPLENLQYLYLINVNIITINSQWPIVCVLSIWR